MAAAAWGIRALPHVVAEAILKGFFLTSFQQVETSLTLAFANFRGLYRQQAVALSARALPGFELCHLVDTPLLSSFPSTATQKTNPISMWWLCQLPKSVPGVKPYHN